MSTPKKRADDTAQFHGQHRTAENTQPDISLYIAGDAPSSRVARKVLGRLTTGGEQPPLEVELIDVLREPDRALQANLLATPTLIIEDGQQRHRYVGDLQGRDDLVRLIDSYRCSLAQGSYVPRGSDNSRPPRTL